MKQMTTYSDTLENQVLPGKEVEESNLGWWKVRKSPLALTLNQRYQDEHMI